MIISIRKDASPDEEHHQIQKGAYLQLNPSATVRKRHPGELVMNNGWISLDYDAEGFLVGMEIHVGDPFASVTEVPAYLQPLNPLRT